MLYVLYTAIAVAFLWAISSVTVRKLSELFGNVRSAVVILVGYAVVLMIILPTSGYPGLTVNSFWESATAGLFIGVGYILVLKSLETESAGSTFVFTELQVIIIAAFGVLILGEHIAAASYIGMALIAAGLVFVSKKDGSRFNLNLMPAVIGNIFWAAGWVALYYPIHAMDSYVFPVTIDYSFAALVALLYLAVNRKKILRRRSKNITRYFVLFVIIAVIAGALGNLIFGSIETSNYIAIGSAIANTSPIIITMIAYIAYKEKLTKMQILGLFVAVSGAVIINVL